MLRCAKDAHGDIGLAKQAAYWQILAGQRFPEVLGFQKDTVQNTFIVPPAAPAL